MMDFDEYKAIKRATQKVTQDIIDTYNALPWWKKASGRRHSIAKMEILKCWAEV